MLRAQVTPFFAQYHSDVAHMTQTQAGAIRPKSLAAFSALSGNPDALVILVRHMGHEIFSALSSIVFHVRAMAKTKPQRRAVSALLTGFDHVPMFALESAARHPHPQ